MRRYHISSDRRVALAATVWILGSIALLFLNTTLGLLAVIAPLVVVLLSLSPWVRLLSVLGAGLYAFGSSTEVGPVKFGFAALLLLVTAVSAYNLAKRPWPGAKAFQAALVVGLVVAATFVLSYLAAGDAASLSAFVRQATPYLVTLCAPIIALETGPQLNLEHVYVMILLAGTVAAVGFAIDWLARRGVTALPIDRFVLSSLILPGYAFAVAVLLIFHGSRAWQRSVAAVVAIAIPIALLISGTRSNLGILAALPAIAGRSRNARVPVPRMLIVLGMLVALGVFIFPLVADYAITDPAFIASRIELVRKVLFGPIAADQSAQLRSEQAALALSIVRANPWFGLGPGVPLDIVLDTPLLTPVRIGVVGTAAVVLFFIMLCVGVRRTRVASGPSVATTAWWGMTAISIVSVAFGTPFEDRGFGLAVMCALVAVASAASGETRAQHVHARPRTRARSVARSTARARTGRSTGGKHLAGQSTAEPEPSLPLS